MDRIDEFLAREAYVEALKECHRLNDWERATEISTKYYVKFKDTHAIKQYTLEYHADQYPRPNYDYRRSRIIFEFNKLIEYIYTCGILPELVSYVILEKLKKEEKPFVSGSLMDLRDVYDKGRIKIFRKKSEIYICGAGWWISGGSDDSWRFYKYPSIDSELLEDLPTYLLRRTPKKKDGSEDDESP